jgi:hypothetical protein
MITLDNIKTEGARQQRIYKGHGYTALVNSYCDPFTGRPAHRISVTCEYEKLIAYPEIFYNEAIGAMDATFNTIFHLREGDEQMWHDGITNASAFIREMNAVLKELDREEIMEPEEELSAV